MARTFCKPYGKSVLHSGKVPTAVFRSWIGGLETYNDAMGAGVCVVNPVWEYIWTFNIVLGEIVSHSSLLPTETGRNSPIPPQRPL